MQQNLISGIKIPLTVTFENIKINECYQYYNRGENGAIVKNKHDPSWSSVLNLSDIFSTLSSLRRAYRELQDIVNLADGSVDSKTKITDQLARLATVKSKLPLTSGLNSTDLSTLIAKIEAANAEAACFANTTTSACTKATVESKIKEVYDEIAKHESIPRANSTVPLEPVASLSNVRMTSSSDCYTGLPNFSSFSGGNGLSIVNMNECAKTAEELQMTQLTPSSCGNGIFYNGTWGDDSDNRYYTVVAGTETYFVTRTDVLSCRNYYAAKKSFWTSTAGCNLGKGNCTGLWTRVSFPYGTSTGEQAAEELAQGFYYSLAAAGGLAALVEFGYGNAVAEALTVSKGDFAITFAITALSCPNCTKEQFIESFALNLAGNQVFKGIFVGLSDAQLLPKARLYAAAYIESLQERALFNKIVAQIAEFGSKVNVLWDSFISKLNGKVSQFDIRRVWNEVDPVVRGNAFEYLRWSQYYEKLGFEYVGRYNNGFFKYFDFWKNGVAVSTKSTNAKTWSGLSDIIKNIDNLSSNIGKQVYAKETNRYYNIATAEVEILVPKGHKEAFKQMWDRLIELGQKDNVTITIIEI